MSANRAARLSGSAGGAGAAGARARTAVLALTVAMLRGVALCVAAALPVCSDSWARAPARLSGCVGVEGAAGAGALAAVLPLVPELPEAPLPLPRLCLLRPA